MAVLYFVINLICLAYLGAVALDPDIPSSVGAIALTMGAGLSALGALCVELRRPAPPVL